MRKWKENKVDEQYLKIAHSIIVEGHTKSNRTGIDTKSLFGKTLDFDLNEGFPVLTSKRVYWKSSFAEILWMLSGSTNISQLANCAKKAWQPWANKNGEIGSAYGKQFRNWTTYYPSFDLLPKHLKEKISPDNFNMNLNPEWEDLIMVKDEYGKFLYWEYKIDQVKKIQYILRNDPNSRRAVISLWNNSELEDMALEPCHFSSIYNVSEGNKLNCNLILRSSDVCLGLPWNICMYALITNILAHCCNLNLGHLRISIADAHIYINHIQGLSQQLDAKTYPLPKLKFLKPEIKEFDEFTYKDFELIDYNHSSPISFEVAV